MEGDQCVVRVYDPIKLPDGTPIVNEFDCPLLERGMQICTFPPHRVIRSVSVVHECAGTCTFVEKDCPQTVERECVQIEQLMYEYAGLG